MGRGGCEKSGGLTGSRALTEASRYSDSPAAEPQPLGMQVHDIICGGGGGNGHVDLVSNAGGRRQHAPRRWGGEQDNGQHNRGGG